MVTGDDLAVSFLPREMLVLMLRPPSLPPSLFKGPSLVVSLSTCNNRGGGGGGGEDILDPTDHGTATHAERGVSSGIASSAGRARPATATAKRCQFVGISNKNRLKNGGAAILLYDIMNAPRLSPFSSSFLSISSHLEVCFAQITLRAV